MSPVDCHGLKLAMLLRSSLISYTYDGRMWREIVELRNVLSIYLPASTLFGEYLDIICGEQSLNSFCSICSKRDVNGWHSQAFCAFTRQI